MTAQGVPLTGPIAKQLYRPMKLWCDEGHHVDPKTFPCDGCRQRVCARHSRWERPTGAAYPARPTRRCDTCARREERPR